MSSPSDRVHGYFSTVQRQLNNIVNEQNNVLHKVAGLWANAIQNDRLLYVFGSGHSRLIAMELYWRAGGLAPALPIEEPTEGAAERLEGYAITFLEHYDVGRGDLLIVISNSGINAVPLEVALFGKEVGATVVALTSLEHSKSVPSRHSSGKRLFEVADHVMDTMGQYGDASTPISGCPWFTGPTSTVVSAAMLNALVAQTAELLSFNGVSPPVLLSANMPEGDEHNNQLRNRYWRRLARFPARRAR